MKNLFYWILLKKVGFFPEKKNKLVSGFWKLVKENKILYSFGLNFQRILLPRKITVQNRKSTGILLQSKFLRIELYTLLYSRIKDKWIWMWMESNQTTTTKDKNWRIKLGKKGFNNHIFFYIRKPFSILRNWKNV